MHKIKVFLSFIFILTLFSSNISFSQWLPSTDCADAQIERDTPYDFYTRGPFFPLTNDTLKVLVVYCNWPGSSGEYEPPDSSVLMHYWPMASAHTLPAWGDSVICPTTTNVWNNSLTALFRDQSLGHFWMIGDVYPHLYTFEHEPSYYSPSNSKNMGCAIKELLESIDDSVDFSQYDKFAPFDTFNKHHPDGVVDFVYIIFRFTQSDVTDPSDHPYTGIADLGGYTQKFDGLDNIKLDNKLINAGFPGSGCLSTQWNPWDIMQDAHEFIIHYSYGRGHNENLGYFSMNGGLICSAEREYIGWGPSAITPTSNSTITLEDFETVGDYIKIPRTSDNIYIENRRRLNYSTKDWHSWKWFDRNPIYKVQRDSGIFIYRAQSYRDFSVANAGGNWNWQKCSGSYYKSTGDPEITPFHDTPDRLNGLDVMDINDVPAAKLNCSLWPSKHSAAGGVGDSNTCFDLGYNEVYSPWSNPSLPVNYSNDSLCVELTQRDHGNMEVKIYFDHLLDAPPSKVTGVNIDDCSLSSYFGFKRPIISWVHNIEPDMIRSIGGINKKRYKIWRSVSADYTSQPSEGSYSLINTVDINADSVPYYIDTSAVSACNPFPDGLCPPSCWVPYNVHYKVQAIDNTDKGSCLSDFVSAVAVKLVSSGGGGSEEDLEERFGQPHIQNTGLNKFSLSQNYPNPFNPTTTISFNIPKLSLVKLIIYDILGREVAILVDEMRSPGIYTVRFDGSALASGIYYCKLVANDVNFTKKMLLIK